MESAAVRPGYPLYLAHSSCARHPCTYSCTTCTYTAPLPTTHLPLPLTFPLRSHHRDISRAQANLDKAQRLPAATQHVQTLHRVRFLSITLDLFSIYVASQKRLLPLPLASETPCADNLRAAAWHGTLKSLPCARSLRSSVQLRKRYVARLIPLPLVQYSPFACIGTLAHPHDGTPPLRPSLPRTLSSLAAACPDLALTPNFSFRSSSRTATQVAVGASASCDTPRSKTPKRLLRL